jgi:hypothetical protein
MTRYRKLPVEIDAIQFLGVEGGMARYAGDAQWLRDAIVANELHAVATTVFVRTLEGEMQASPGDWIIRGTAGELYPCKPDIFEAIYEPVSA